MPISYKGIISLTQLVDANLMLYFLIKLSCRGIDLAATKVVISVLDSLVVCYYRTINKIVNTRNTIRHAFNYNETDTNTR